MSKMINCVTVFIGQALRPAAKKNFEGNQPSLHNIYSRQWPVDLQKQDTILFYEILLNKR
jgi:hypothetical protein